MSDRATGSWRWVLASGLTVAVLLRAAGLSTEVWMDEILSVRLVEALRSPLGMFTDIHSDNNHYLNSLWLWVVGAAAPGWMMRLPTLVLGAALVVLAYRVTRSRGRTEAALTAALFAVSYPLIHYSSEARGYGYLVFFTLAAYGAFRRWTSAGGARAGAAYSVGAALAFLSHLGFATVFAALVLWSVLEVIDSRDNRARVAWSHAGVHVLPAVTLLVLYLIDIRYMSAAGGFARLGPLESLAGAAGLVTGVAPGAVGLLVAVCAWVAIAFGVRSWYHESRNETVFLVAAIAFSLASGALPGYGYPRYYLTALLFSLLFLGHATALAIGSERWKVLGVSLLVTVGAVNLTETVRFVSVGRGMYREATQYMASEATPAPVTVAGSHDLGSVLALGYYAPSSDEEGVLKYYCHRATTYGCSRARPSSSRGEDPPRFYLLASLDDRFSPPDILSVPDLDEYEFVRSYPKYGLSGVYWALYERSGQKSAP
jgi:hypothetical protein